MSRAAIMSSKILANDVAFTSDQYAKKLEAMLGDYDHRAWLRQGERIPGNPGLFHKFMLGMTSEDEEKIARLQLLKVALGASNVEAVRKQIGGDVGPIAMAIVDKAISDGREARGFDIVQPIAYGAPLACAVKHLGFPELTGFSDAYKALYFERPSFASARDLGFIDQFPQGQDQLKLLPELFVLVHSIALCLLIDQYDTPSALELAKVAVRKLLNDLAKEVLAEEGRIARGHSSPTLLSRLLQHRTDGVDPATFRARVGMIIAELVVGGVDTTAKGITNVVDCLLSNPDVLKHARDAVESRADFTLDAIILEALRINPVADLIVRDCPKGATLPLQDGPFQFEAGGRLFLIPGAAMQDPGASQLPSSVNLRTFVLDQTPEVQRALYPIRRLGFGDGAHGCLGSEIVLAEIREVLKQLFALKIFGGPPDQQARSTSASVCRSPLEYGSIHNRLNSGSKRCSLVLAARRKLGSYAKIAPKFGGDSEVAGRFGSETALREKGAERELNAREKRPHPPRLGKSDRFAIGLKDGVNRIAIRGRHDVPA